ncbi:FMN-binding glutamate synthase family protein [Novosphingobium album (ex Liu et al. 2023)]|uniref:FMN-binding glutamate synthase family protein n=1 Tax=Novosphingobium album (ex Liu et al. 2023) TaxID=3031130 RepID=A0ABT5WPU1_9SPHN|nr:FMN-binding glutamate synthase family protein [Novosphingobium album (ex Liu et al. 2023)]MDE8651776.1 FMN-binding glutamate synthase family protein [Novosphingobium album (ex Liu et al. 2023)]
MPNAPRYTVPLFLVAAVALCWFVPPLRWALVLFVPLLAIALWDFLQGSHALRRNYPLIARVRWLFEDLRPFLRAYIVESDREGRPFTIDERSLVYARAKGAISTHPMGTELDVYSDEYEWLGHSIVPTEQAPASWRLRIGGPDCLKPYESSLLNISAMSFGSLSARAVEALNKGAALGGFAQDTGEGGICTYHRKHGGDLIWEIGSGYFGCRTRDGGFDPEKFAAQASADQVKMVEIKLSQGAKPGHGGVLPGPKVTPEIADARKVEPWQDCLSPAAHSTFSTPIGLLEWIVELRRLSGGKPAGFKLCIGQPHEVMALCKAMVETGITPDFIVIDGAEGGTGAAPQELTDNVGMPLREGLIHMGNALVGTNLRDRIRLGASGKVHSGAGMARAIALGADWCNAARAFMFSLGCVQSMKCHTGNCPTGVATQEAWRQQGLVIEEKAERVARFHAETLKALREILVAMGLENPWALTHHDMFQRIDSAKAGPLDEVYEFLRPGQLLEDPDSTSYARAWRNARADTFRRA